MQRVYHGVRHYKEGFETLVPLYPRDEVIEDDPILKKLKELQIRAKELGDRIDRCVKKKEKREKKVKKQLKKMEKMLDFDLPSIDDDFAYDDIPMYPERTVGHTHRIRVTKDGVSVKTPNKNNSLIPDSFRNINGVQLAFTPGRGFSLSLCNGD